MKLRIKKVMGVKMDTLLRMQMWFNAHRMRKREETVKIKQAKTGRFGASFPRAVESVYGVS